MQLLEQIYNANISRLDSTKRKYIVCSYMRCHLTLQSYQIICDHWLTQNLIIEINLKGLIQM